MFSARYGRALLRQKAVLLGSTAAVARLCGISYRTFLAMRAGGYGREKGRYRRLSPRIQKFLRVREVYVYVPLEMTDDEVDRRLALARRGTAPTEARAS